MHKLLVTLILSLLLCLSNACANSPLARTDNTNARPVLNTYPYRFEIRRIDNTEASGIAIDLAANLLYIGASGGQITGRDLNTPERLS